MGCSSSKADTVSSEQPHKTTAVPETKPTYLPLESVEAEGITEDRKRVAHIIAGTCLTPESSNADTKSRRQSYVRMMSEKRISEGQSSKLHDNRQPSNRRSLIDRRATEPLQISDDKENFRKERLHCSARDLERKTSRKSLIRRLSEKATLGKLFGMADASEPEVRPLSPLLGILKMKYCKSCWVTIVSYLSVRCLGVLDMAVTGHELRGELLDCIAKLPFLQYTEPIRKSFARWVEGRGLLLGGVVQLHSWEADETCALVGQRCDAASVREIVLRRGASHVGSLSGQAIRHICQQCPNITSLDLSECRSVVDLDIDCIAQSNRSLRRLVLRGCVLITDTSVAKICDTYSGIEYLNLSFCRQITDESLRALAACGLSCLRSLSLLECRRVTNEGISILCCGCPELQELNISYCGRLTDEALVEMSKKCSALMSVSLMGLRHITDRGVQAVAQSNHDLLALDLRRCAGITDDTPAALAANTPKLQQLYLSECRSLTDESVAALAYGCSELTTLFISECALITDLGLEALPYGCAKLRVLDASYCPNIRADTVDSLLADYPSLYIYCNCYSRPINPPDFLLS